jgi:hypothetical protein
MLDDIQLYIPVKKETVEKSFNTLDDLTEDDTNEELVPFTQEIVEKIAAKFTNFELNNLQVSVSAKIGSGNALKWVVSLEGTGGLVLNFKKL